MAFRLNRKNLGRLPAAVRLPAEFRLSARTQRHPGRSGTQPAMLHFGMGGFHRSHQAWYFQRLIDLDPEKFGRWSIAAACIMPGDKALVENMRRQDCLYTLKSSGEGPAEVSVISSIKEVFFGPAESELIIDRIASPETKIVSFTITEGGYMLDEASGEFRIDHPDIVSDLKAGNVPKTVFGYLARGLARRRDNEAGRPPTEAPRLATEAGADRLILLSCDNVQENGRALQRALLAFLDAYDRDLKAYVSERASFPNSMVDRITPVSTPEDKDRFEQESGYRDECLVVSEKFSQWVIEETPETGSLPFRALPFREMGVTLVKDVKPYEKMKLRILNGGHSLAGLLGKALGYEYIYEAVRDERISRLFDLYIEKEVIPSLEEIKDVSYTAYMRKVKSRFAQELIPDTTGRIISFSSAKIPKFILPVLRHSLDAGVGKPFLISSLIIAAWWHYLKTQVNSGRASEIEDALKERWEAHFQTFPEDSVAAFLRTREVFGELGDNTQVQQQVKELTTIITASGMEQAIEFVFSISWS